MKKKNIVNIICFIILLLSLIMIIKSLCSLTTGGQQAIETTDTEIKKDPITIVDFDDSMVNVGTLRKDTVIHHGYTFHNVGDKPLIVYYVRHDCNCTGYSISKKWHCLVIV